DAGRRRQEARDGRHLGLEPAALFSPDERERDAVARPAREQALEFGLLLLSQGADQLAGPPVGDHGALAELVEQLLAPHAQPRLQGSLGVVHAGVDHLAVAARGLAAGPLAARQTYPLPGTARPPAR